MSFVAEAVVGGRGEGKEGGGEGLGVEEREKVLSRQPLRATEDPDRKLRDPNHK